MECNLSGLGNKSHVASGGFQGLIPQFPLKFKWSVICTGIKKTIIQPINSSNLTSLSRLPCPTDIFVLGYTGWISLIYLYSWIFTEAINTWGYNCSAPPRTDISSCQATQQHFTYFGFRTVRKNYKCEINILKTDKPLKFQLFWCMNYSYSDTE